MAQSQSFALIGPSASNAPLLLAVSLLRMVTEKIAGIRATMVGFPPPASHNKNPATDCKFDDFRLVFKAALRRVLGSSNLRSG